MNLQRTVSVPATFASSYVMGEQVEQGGEQAWKGNDLFTQSQRFLLNTKRVQSESEVGIMSDLQTVTGISAVTNGDYKSKRPMEYESVVKREVPNSSTSGGESVSYLGSGKMLEQTQGTSQDSSKKHRVLGREAAEVPASDPAGRRSSVPAKSGRSGGKRQKGKDRSRYKGVRQRASGRWISEIKDTIQGVRMWLGTYDTAEEAALAYDQAARTIRGAAAKTNFSAEKPPPEWAVAALAVNAALNGQAALSATLQSSSSAASGLVASPDGGQAASVDGEEHSTKFQFGRPTPAVSTRSEGLSNGDENSQDLHRQLPTLTVDIPQNAGGGVKVEPGERGVSKAPWQPDAEEDEVLSPSTDLSAYLTPPYSPYGSPFDSPLTASPLDSPLGSPYGSSAFSSFRDPLFEQTMPSEPMVEEISKGLKALKPLSLQAFPSFRGGWVLPFGEPAGNAVDNFQESHGFGTVNAEVENGGNVEEGTNNWILSPRLQEHGQATTILASPIARLARVETAELFGPCAPLLQSSTPVEQDESFDVECMTREEAMGIDFFDHAAPMTSVEDSATSALDASSRSQPFEAPQATHPVSLPMSEQKPPTPWNASRAPLSHESSSSSLPRRPPPRSLVRSIAGQLAPELDFLQDKPVAGEICRQSNLSRGKTGSSATNGSGRANGLLAGHFSRSDGSHAMVGESSYQHQDTGSAEAEDMELVMPPPRAKALQAHPDAEESFAIWRDLELTLASPSRPRRFGPGQGNVDAILVDSPRAFSRFWDLPAFSGVSPNMGRWTQNLS